MRADTLRGKSLDAGRFHELARAAGLDREADEASQWAAAGAERHDLWPDDACRLGDTYRTPGGLRSRSSVACLGVFVVAGEGVWTNVITQMEPLRYRMVPLPPELYPPPRLLFDLAMEHGDPTGLHP